jgi:hypothetical protein
MSIEIDGVGTTTMKHFYDAMDKENRDWLPETNNRFIKITSDEGGNYVLNKLIYKTQESVDNFYGVDRDVWELIAEHIPKLERPQTLQDLISKVKDIAKEELDDYVILASFFYSGVGAVPRVLYEQAVEQAVQLNYKPLFIDAYGGLIAHLCWYKVNSESPAKVNGDPLVKALKSQFYDVEERIYEKFDPNNISTWPKETDPVYDHYQSLHSLTDITKGITTDIKEMKDAITKFSNQKKGDQKKGGNLTRRKASKRKASKRKAIRRKSMKRKNFKRKATKRKNSKRKATRRKNTRRRRR